MFKVLSNLQLTPSAHVIRFARGGMEFQPGQHLSVGCKGDLNMREYSIYSSVAEDFVEILVKRVEGGFVSPRLCDVRVGDELNVEGPFGYFTLGRTGTTQPVLMVASGTGISPFRSMVRSVTGLDYTLVHGVRTLAERYQHEDFEAGRVVSCVSREDGGTLRGRVTNWVRAAELAPGTKALLCGNCDMIYEVYDLLLAKGLGADDIAAEVYF